MSITEAAAAAAAASINKAAADTKAASITESVSNAEAAREATKAVYQTPHHSCKWLSQRVTA